MIRYDDTSPPPDGPPEDGRSVPRGAGELPPAAGAADGLSAELADTVRQRDEFHDLLLRKTAEFDNYRKRSERERRELADYATGEFVKELLPILDDFTRALAAPAATSPEAYRQGVELIHKRLLEALGSRGVVVIDPLGEPFDPHQHEAVARVAADGRRDGEVVEVFSPGYKLGDRLLRPAMVKVATA
jgi:molecular chaperone GrpE